MDENSSKEFTLKQWLLTFVILIIPIVNLVFLLMWAFGEEEGAPRKNYSRALLIMVGVMVCLGGIASVINADATDALLIIVGTIVCLGFFASMIKIQKPPSKD